MKAMGNLLSKRVVHNFCINTIEEMPEDKTVLKFKAVVLDFKVSHNGWAISSPTAEKYMYTLLHKHIVTKYYSEGENGGIDALGDHAEGAKKLRGTKGEITIPCTGTHSIGTITDVYIAPLNDKTEEPVLWCEGILLAWDNINECSLLLEWAENGVPILVSVEWYYTQSMLDNDGAEWIVDPTFSALTILNSEQRGNKDIVYGNYDCAHIQVMLNSEYYRQFNHAALKDVNTKKGRGKEMSNIFLKALNDISFEGIRGKIYGALEKQMTAEEYKTVWISMWDIYETYFVYTVFEGKDEKHYKIHYEKVGPSAITLDYASKVQVERQDVYVEVSELAEIDAKAKEDLDKLEVALDKANEKIRGLQADSQKLKTLEAKLNKIENDEKLNAALQQYKNEFEEFNALDVFLSEEVHGLIEDTLVPEKQAKAVIKLQKILLTCAKNNQVSPRLANSRTSTCIEGACYVGNRTNFAVNDTLDRYGFIAEN